MRNENELKAALEKVVEQTLDDVLRLAESIMDEVAYERLDKQYYEVGFNLKTTILLHRGTKIK